MPWNKYHFGAKCSRWTTQHRNCNNRVMSELTITNVVFFMWTVNMLRIKDKVWSINTWAPTLQLMWNMILRCSSPSLCPPKWTLFLMHTLILTTYLMKGVLVPSTNLNFPKGFKNGKQKSRFVSSKYNKIKAAKSRSTMQESNLSFGVYKEISLCKYIINQQKLWDSFIFLLSLQNR